MPLSEHAGPVKSVERQTGINATAQNVKIASIKLAALLEYYVI